MEEPSEPYSRNKMRMRNQAKANNTGPNVIRNKESIESSLDPGQFRIWTRFPAEN